MRAKIRVRGARGRRSKRETLAASAGRVVEQLESRQLLDATAHYFNTPDWTGTPVTVQNDWTNHPYDVNANWQTGSPDPAVRNDGFSAIYTGQIHAATGGVYTFVSATDDEGFLFVNGRLVSREATSHTLRLAPNVTPITLPAGSSNDFIFYQRDRGGASAAIMNWITPDNPAAPPTPVPGYLMSSFSSYSTTPPVPTNLTATAAGPLGITLQWTGDSRRATRYAIERSTDGTNFSPLATSGFVFNDGTTGGVPTRFTDGSVRPGQTYSYRVRALNFDTGGSGFSATASAATPALDPAASGVEAHFYNRPLWTGTPQWGTVAPNIAMTLANGAGPAPAIQSHDFSSIFTGKLNVTTGGVYTLLSNTDDDGYLYVDGALVSLDPGAHGQRNAANFTPVTLSPGAHDVVFQQSQGLNASGAVMLYAGPDTGGELTVVPGGVLTPVSDTPATPTGLAAFATSSDAVTLRWQDNSISEAQYLIERSTDGVQFDVVGRAGIVANPAPGAVGTATYVDSVDPGTHYVYRVVALNFDGESTSATTPVDTPARTLTTIDYGAGFAGSGPTLLLDGYKSFDSPHPAFDSPPVITSDGHLRLTDDQLGESRAAFTAARVPIDVFSTSFVYQPTFNALPTDASATAPFADGITFTIQNYNPGAPGVGYGVSGGVGGQGLGYAGTPRSVAVKLDLYQNPGDPVASTTGVFTAGSTPVGGESTLASLNLRSGHPIAVNLSYRRDTRNLLISLTDTVTGQSYTTSNYYVDIPSMVGGDWAYVGFTGASGGGHATQDVLKWTYSGRLGPPQLWVDYVYGTYGQTPTTLTASLSYLGTPLQGKVLDFMLDGIDVGTAVTDANGVATLQDPALATIDAGSHYLSVSAPGDDLYADGFGYGYVTVYSAQASMQLTGPGAVTATATGDVTIPLQAVLQDATGGAGDIRKADVWFYVYGSDGTYWPVQGSAVRLVSAPEVKTGISTASLTTHIYGSAPVTYSVYASAGNDYWGSAYGTVAASMPQAGAHVSGAGQLTAANSAGLYAADAGSSISFSITSRNMSGTADGSVTLTFDHTGSDGRKRTYQVQSTAVSSYGGASGIAAVVATANLSDVTDPRRPILLATGLRLNVSLTDRGSPGSNDSIAFSLWGTGGLYFSSDWTGLGTAEDKLKSGNLTLH